MSSYLNAGGRRLGAGATVYLFLALLGAGAGFLGIVQARQPASLQLLDASGRPVGSEANTVQVKATGWVLDAESGQELAEFYLTKGAQDRERTGFDWAETNRLRFVRGVFSVELAKERLPPAVLIEADGYLPQCSGPVRTLETNMIFRLKKGRGPEGVLLTTNGQPAAGCTVYFSRLKDLVFLEGSNLAPGKLSARVRTNVTDPAGRFSFAPDLDAFAVMAADDGGFAMTRVEDLKRSLEVRLQRWARVEGTLKVGTQPAGNETVRLASAFAEYAYYPRPLPPFAISVATTTDSQGRFVFPRVPPVDVKIFYAPMVGRGDTRLIPMTQVTNITLKAGETRTVTLGGQGRAIIGRIELKNYTKPIHWQDEVFWIDSVAPVPADCPNFNAIDQEYRSARSAAKTQEDIDSAQVRYLAQKDRIARQLRDYYSSAPGRRYWFSKRLYVLKFAPDGSFRIDDVPGGKYQLSIDLRELDGRMGQFRSPLIDLHRQEIDVPDCAGGRSDEPLDLGVIKMVAQLIQGQAAPDFATKTVEGKTVKLSDYKGKNVLLAFWASWNAPSAAVMPELKQTFAAFKDDPRFAMIGLSLDTNIAAVRDFSTQIQTGWTQGFLGKWLDTDVPDRFGVETLPFIILVDTNGTVVAPGLRAGEIRSTVDAVLSSHD